MVILTTSRDLQPWVLYAIISDIFAAHWYAVHTEKQISYDYKFIMIKIAQ